jgi:hypothetical protein
MLALIEEVVGLLRVKHPLSVMFSIPEIARSRHEYIDGNDREE